MPTNPMTAARCAEIRERANAATPGPWRRGHVSGRCPLQHRHGEGSCEAIAVIQEDDSDVIQDREYSPYSEQNIEAGLIAGMWDYEAGGVQRPVDSIFIAAARTDVPDLAAMLERAMGQLASLWDGSTRTPEMRDLLREWRGEI